MLKKIRLIIIAVTVSFAGIMPISRVNAEPAQDISIKYQGHVQNDGWQTSYAKDGQVAGTSGRALRIEALNVELESQISGVKVLFETHVQNLGWSKDWLVCDSANKLTIGTTGSGLRMEAFKIKLEGAPADYHIQYQAHVQNIGWQEWVEDGDVSGSTGKSLRIEALKIKIVKEPDNNNIIAYATNFLGTPYKWGGTTPSGFDCSGFTQYVYRYFGISLGRTTYDQIKNGVSVSKSELQPGDLIFFGSWSDPYHMGMYVGNGMYIHAPRTGDVIKISSIERGDYVTARRVK